MVFESLVADLLNRFLGDFIDNLDASQLNIGIWGGMYFHKCKGLVNLFAFRRCQIAQFGSEIDGIGFF